MKKRSLNHYFLVAPGFTLKIRTNTPKLHKIIAETLFPIKVRKATKNFFVIHLFWNHKTKNYELLRRDGKKIWARSTLPLIPFLDEEVRWKILTRLPEHLFPIHSAGLIENSKAILLLGEAGAGKSTALFDFVRQGYAGLSDELNFLDLRTFRVYPYFRTWILKALPRVFSSKKYTEVPVLRNKPKGGAKLTHFCFNSNIFRRRLQNQSFPLQKIFYLKSRSAKKLAFKRLSPVEVFEKLSDNVYAITFRKGFKSPYMTKYKRLLIRLFRAFPKFQNRLAGFELKTTKKTKSSNLIKKYKLLKSSKIPS